MARMGALDIVKRFSDNRRTEEADAQARATNEANMAQAQYELQRRQTTDQRKDAAFNALQSQYGDVAGDPVTYGQLEGIGQRKELQPLVVRAQEQAIQSADQERLRGATENALQYVRKTVDDGGDPAAALASLPPAFRQAIGLDDEQVAQYGAAFRQDPSQITAMLEGLQGRPKTGTPGKPFEVVDQTTGETVLVTQDPATGQLIPVEGYGPVADPDAELDRAYRMAQIDATQALSEQRRRPPASSRAAGDKKSEAGLNALYNLQDNISDMRSVISTGAEDGTFVDAERGGLEGFVQNAAAMVSSTGAGQMAQKALDPKRQRNREALGQLTAQMAANIRDATDMGARMLDTEKEYARFITQINDPTASVQAMNDALERLERTYLRELRSFEAQASAPEPNLGVRDPDGSGGQASPPRPSAIDGLSESARRWLEQ